jgi:hypothetical protein
VPDRPDSITASGNFSPVAKQVIPLNADMEPSPVASANKATFTRRVNRRRIMILYQHVNPKLMPLA